MCFCAANIARLIDMMRLRYEVAQLMDFKFASHSHAVLAPKRMNCP